MIQKIIELLQALTDLRVLVKSRGDTELLSKSGNAILPEPGRVELITDSNDVRFLVCAFQESIFLIGPFLLEDDPIPAVGRPVSRGIAIPIRSMEKVRAYQSAFCALAEQKEGVGDQELNETVVRNQVFDKSSRSGLKDIDTRYALEQKLRNAIAEGDRPGLISLMNIYIPKNLFANRNRNNPVRVWKNIGIVLNTIGRLSAERGGLPPSLLHSLSESIAIEIEMRSTFEDLRNYLLEIPLLYCDAVSSCGIENYSRNIVKACQYIVAHLYKKVTLEDLAAYTGINPSYLSRRFKEETGQNISAYIRNMRMKEARWRLIRTGESVTDIALSLGFEDVNYFSRIFRMETGLSPREYRLKRDKTDFTGFPG